MPIDPDLYEKVTGRTPGDAQRRLGESLASNVKRKARNEELKSIRQLGFGYGWRHYGWIRFVIETGGWWGVAFVIVVFVGLFLWWAL